MHRLKFLDGVRGLAALYVVIGHARWLLWEGYSEGYLTHPHDYSFLSKLCMYGISLFRYGHEVVLLFFVLSGFVIHLKYANQLKRKTFNFSFADYFTKRAKRIFPPFLFALALTFCLDSLGRYLHYTPYFGTTNYSEINKDIGQNLLPSTFFGNIAFLYEKYVPLFGSNGPSWSLKYEWWFYMLYPLFLVISKRNLIKSSLLMVILFLASYFQIWPEDLLRDVFTMMVGWWLGVLLAEVFVERINVSLSNLSFLMLIFLVAPFIKPLDISAYDLVIAIGFTGFLSAMLNLSPNNLLVRALEKIKLLGDFSYSLYILHFPILVFISGILMKWKNNTLPANFYFVFAGVLIAMLFSYLVHFIVETPFIMVRKSESGQ